MAGSQIEITVKRLTEIEEFRDAVRLQQEIWGFEDIELLPVRLFVVGSKVGGQTFGAFDGERMIGFLLAIPGLKNGGVMYLHSHMMGVLPECRNHGVGRRLKFAQREEALQRGIQLVEWTFDPLEIKNAHFNIERLGAVVRRYVLNQYGTTTSHLHGGLPTDRCVAEWYLSSDRALAAERRLPIPRPEATDRIAVPSNIADLRVNEPKQAREIQSRVSKGFQELTSRGHAVVGFERTPDAGVYLFAPWHSE